MDKQKLEIIKNYLLNSILPSREVQELLKLLEEVCKEDKELTK
jgi:hypothetical protein